MSFKYQKLLWAIGVIVLCLGAFGLRAWNLGRAELTFDEVATVYVARRTPLEVLLYVMGAIREHPPLYYVGMSLWFRVAGETEFAIRYPSVLIGMLLVALGVRQGRKWMGMPGGWFNGALLALLPLSLWASRTGRMYSLVMLLGLLTLDAWQRWAERPTWRRWGVFMGLTFAGAMTHYLLALLWIVEGALLFFAPRKTRGIRWTWLATTAAIAVAVAGLVWMSPGMRLTLVSVLRSFPLRQIRVGALKSLITELYLYWLDPARFPMVLAALALTLLGWWQLWRKEKATGALLAAWGLLPIAVMNFVPVDLNARYLIMTLPAITLGLSAAITLTRPWPLQWLLAGAILAGCPLNWEQVYHPLEGTFAVQTRFLADAACPGDAVVLNGPWPDLLFNYYPLPSGIRKYLVPVQAPPGFDAAVDIPRLEAMAANHTRLWVYYGAIRPTDPRYATSRWLAENTYAVYAFEGMRLYLSGQVAMTPVLAGVSYGDPLYLRQAAVDRQTVSVGESLRVQLLWERRHIQTEPALTLALRDKKGFVWASQDFRMGPEHRPDDASLPMTWADLRGLWIAPGVPPGEYQLALRVESRGITQPTADRWLPLTSITVTRATATCAPNLEGALPNASDLHVAFGDQVTLVGLEPWDDNAMQGYPAGLRLWWKTQSPSGDARLRVRLAGVRTVDVGAFAPGPDFYPVAGWQPGDVIRHELSFVLPDDLPAGRYHVQVQWVAGDGTVQEAAGDRKTLTPGERWRGARVSLQGAWADVYVLRVEARQRSYAPPLARRRVDVSFGDVLRLRGYRLSRASLRAGESAELTVYWQALQRPTRIYAAFNHLRAADNQILWKQDSWPQEGLYTTDHWLKGEVVAERYVISVPEDTPPGEYPLYVGLYTPDNVARLSATRPNGARYSNDEVVLQTIEVKP
ncbi:MAG: glycosyltransferase family 39 protein [Anaerolineae bacterium]|nr:glycosyltransferase family 39 protein [Anaerolineae bacterium]